MGRTKYIMLHCTATPEGREVTPEDIVRWHTSPRSQGGRGWKQVGYSHLIQLDGTVIELVGNNGDDYVDNWEITNGARGFNNVTVHVVYAGGLEKKRRKGMKRFFSKDSRTPEQKKAMEILVKELLEQHPKAKLIGHNDVANKACPSFNVRNWGLSVGINKLRLV